MNKLIAIRAKNWQTYCPECFAKSGLEERSKISMLDEAGRCEQAILCENNQIIAVFTIQCSSCRKILFEPESETEQRHRHLVKMGLYSSDGRLKSPGEINRRSSA